MLIKKLCKAFGFNPDNREEFKKFYETSWVDLFKVEEAK